MRVRSIRFTALITLLCTLVFLSVYAIGDAAVVELKSVEDRMTLFVKGTGEVSGVTVMLGRYSGRDISVKTVQDAGITVKTLFLIDNSLSIPKASREKICEALLDIIAARRNHEKFAVGTISDKVEILQDFTDEYMALKMTIEGVPYRDQDAWLEDSLYRCVSELPVEVGEFDFIRLFLISDGMDQNVERQHEHSREDLLALLSEQPIPIYTLGIRNGDSSNRENLENLSALANSTGAQHFTLDSNMDTDALITALSSDWNNLMIKLTVPEEAQDGSSKTLTLTLKNGEESRTLTFDNVRMPLLEISSGQDLDEDSTEEDTQNVEEDGNVIPYIIIGSLGTLLVIALIAVVILLKKHRDVRPGKQRAVPIGPVRKKLYPDEDSPTVHDGRIQSSPDSYSPATQMDGEDEGTVLVRESGPVYTVVLTDVQNPEKRFSKTIADSLVIGYSSNCDICFNYDRSVSRKHCGIVKEGERLFIVNYSHANGTYVNGSLVEDRIPVSSGDTVKMGRVEVRVEIHTAGSP